MLIHHNQSFILPSSFPSAEHFIKCLLTTGNFSILNSCLSTSLLLFSVVAYFICVAFYHTLDQKLFMKYMYTEALSYKN